MSADPRQRLVVAHSVDPAAAEHEVQGNLALARWLAEVQKLEFGGRYEPELHQRGPLYLVPTRTLVGRETAIQAGLENIEVCGDPTRIRQILVNLLGNALKFTEEGAIHLSLEWQALDHDVLWLTCAVHDSGIGISPERLEHMFDAFQQADSSISRRYGGTGLGLAIARTLAERMGGTLQAESKEGSGSTFTLEIPLPFQQSPAHRQQAAGDAAPVAITSSTGPRRVSASASQANGASPIRPGTAGAASKACSRRAWAASPWPSASRLRACNSGAIHSAGWPRITGVRRPANTSRRSASQSMAVE